MDRHIILMLIKKYERLLLLENNFVKGSLYQTFILDLRALTFPERS